MANKFNLAALGAIFCFTAGVAVPASGQQAPSYEHQLPAHAEDEVSKYKTALSELQKLNAALEKRVKELEDELAACKAQMETLKPH